METDEFEADAVDEVRADDPRFEDTVPLLEAGSEDDGPSLLLLVAVAEEFGEAGFNDDGSIPPLLVSPCDVGDV